MSRGRRIFSIALPSVLFLAGVSFWVITAWMTMATDYVPCRQAAAGILVGQTRQEVLERLGNQQTTTQNDTLVATCSPPPRRGIPLRWYPVKAVQTEVHFDRNGRVATVRVDDLVILRRSNDL